MDMPAFAYGSSLRGRVIVATLPREVADVEETEGYRVLVQDDDFAASGDYVC
jgi:hypothetical protein